MPMLSRSDIKLVVVAAVCLGAGVATPAIGAAIVANADKVDGFHAVGFGSTVTARKGKLVATSSTTGLLPNNIIKKAPDADKLDGVNSTAFARRQSPVPYAFASQGGIQSVVHLTSAVTLTSAAIPAFDPCGGGQTVQHFAVVANAVVTESTAADAATAETARLAVTTGTSISPGGSDVLQKTNGTTTTRETVGTNGVLDVPATGGTISFLADILASDDPVGAQYTVTRGYLTVTGLGWSC